MMIIHTGFDNATFRRSNATFRPHTYVHMLGPGDQVGMSSEATDQVTELSIGITLSGQIVPNQVRGGSFVARPWAVWMISTRY